MELFNLLEDSVELSIKSGFSTEKATENLEGVINSLDRDKFVELLAHAGYIPDLYGDDSSEETLYSKFVELLTCIWAKKIGFDRSYLPTKKSGTEDITIQDKNYLIVSDAKSHRLSRSSFAPNPKDALKPGDFENWKLKHEGRTVLGGLITFPAMHEWKRGSIVHTYLTDKKNKICLLYYGHMSAILKFNIKKDAFVKYFSEFEDIYPNKIESPAEAKEVYYANVRNRFFCDCLDEYDEYMDSLKNINREILKKSIEKIPSSQKFKTLLQEEVDSIDCDEEKIDFLITELIKARAEKMEKKIREIKTKRKAYF